MIQKNTFLKTSDKTNIKWMKTIHLYKGYSRKKSKTGLFIKNIAKTVKPPKIEYKGFKRKYIKKGDIVRSIIIKTIFKYNNNFKYVTYFSNNSTILIKKKNLPKSKYFFGLISKNILKKKFLVLFDKKL